APAFAAGALSRNQRATGSDGCSPKVDVSSLTLKRILPIAAWSASFLDEVPMAACPWKSRACSMADSRSLPLKLHKQAMPHVRRRCRQHAQVAETFEATVRAAHWSLL